MHDEKDQQRLDRLILRNDAFIEVSKLLTEAKTVLGTWDKSIAQHRKRAHGDRTKLPGGLVLEEMAVDAIRILKPHFAADGLSTAEAWKQAELYVGSILDVSYTVLREWRRGAAKRRRKKAARLKSAPPSSIPSI